MVVGSVDLVYIGAPLDGPNLTQRSKDLEVKQTVNYIRYAASHNTNTESTVKRKLM